MLKRLIVMVGIVMVAFAAPALSKANVSVKGIIVDTGGTEVPVVKVILHEAGKQTYSDKAGRFVFNSISPGRYQVSLRRIGCQPADTMIDVSENMKELRLVINDSYIITEKVVVTGTRTVKQAESNPISTELIPSERIKNAGSLRLDNVLSEETGLYTYDANGKGIQIQGLDADYALILINGEPLIGRNGGVLDLKRVSASNIKRVEVVKGPSSSLYGSNALSGVVNIITNEPEKPFSFSAASRYESHSTLDLNANAGLLMLDSKLGVNLFADRLSSAGFEGEKNSDVADREHYGKVVPEYENYTGMADIFYYFSSSSQAKLGYRINAEDQWNSYDVTSNGRTFLIDDHSSLRDNGLSLMTKIQATERLSFELRGYYSKYQTKTQYNYNLGDSLYQKYFFDQSLAKYELQINHMLYHSHILTFGGGADHEYVKSERIGDNAINADSYYAFMQEDYLPGRGIDIIGSFRYDTHSDYGSHFSPKLALSCKVFNGFIFKASAGSGFKAPTFQQLYLDWTNSIAGYSVFGSAYFEEGFKKLEESGVIREILIPLEKIKELKPEESISFNTGFVWDINSSIQAKANFFRNNLSEMIETMPVATKASGQQVFTYFNLNKVYTQGVELNFSFRPTEKLNVACGYQYLEAYDKQVIADIKAGKRIINVPGGERKMTLDDYGGLFNRSKHSANLRIEYSEPKPGYSINLRMMYRGRYGFEDRNSTTVLDADNEYAPGYMIWNMGAAKELFGKIRLQAGIDNIFDKMDKVYLVTNPGRTFYLSLSYSFNAN